MKNFLIWLALVFCIATLVYADDPAEFLWQNPAGDPLQLTFGEAINVAPIPDQLKDMVIASYPDSFRISYVNKGEALEDWMLFGNGRIEKNVRNSWNGKLFRNGVVIGPVPAIGIVQERNFDLPTYQDDSTSVITSYRIRIWRWCGNVSGSKLLVSKYAKAPVSQPEVKVAEVPEELPPPPPKKQPSLSLDWIGEASHWNNNQDPLIRYEEGKLGLRFGYQHNGNFSFETDLWPIVARVHTVNNGDGHAIQWWLGGIQPKVSFRPTGWSYVLLSDALTISSRGKDTNTVLGMLQARVSPLFAGSFQPMFQLGGSITDSWPRYLGNNKYPESRAQYSEVSARLQVFNFGEVIRTGWEAKWFDFKKTRVDPDLKETSDLCYMAKSRPVFGGPFVQVKLPWSFYLDGALTRVHIDANTYTHPDPETYKWVRGDQDEWRANLVLSRAFTLGLFR